MKLPLKKYRPAVYVAPRQAGKAPWPVVVILHGNFDRPEWECEWWLAARRLGWLLCPRGMRRPGVPRPLDRWTYAGSRPAIHETHAALDRLAEKHRDLLRERDATFIGFSLGAILGPRFMLGSRLRFRRAIFVEGGAGVDHAQIKKLAKGGLQRVAYLCGQHTSCGPKAQKALRRWKRRGIPARLWLMPGVGHNYNQDFDPLAKKVLTWLTAPAPPPTNNPTTQ